MLLGKFTSFHLWLRSILGGWQGWVGGGGVGGVSPPCPIHDPVQLGGGGGSTTPILRGSHRQPPMEVVWSVGSYWNLFCPFLFP